MEAVWERVFFLHSRVRPSAGQVFLSVTLCKLASQDPKGLDMEDPSL
jgi:hypothetical protein